MNTQSISDVRERQLFTVEDPRTACEAQPPRARAPPRREASQLPDRFSPIPSPTI